MTFPMDYSPSEQQESVSEQLSAPEAEVCEIVSVCKSDLVLRDEAWPDDCHILWGLDDRSRSHPRLLLICDCEVYK